MNRRPSPDPRTAGMRRWVPYVLFSIGVWTLLMGIYVVARAFQAEFTGVGAGRASE